MLFTGTGPLEPAVSPAVAAENEAAVIGAAVGGAIAGLVVVAAVAVVVGVPSVRKRVLPFTARRDAEALKSEMLHDYDDENRQQQQNKNAAPATNNRGTWVSSQPRPI